MENAVKALTMAGGILIAIMVIAALVYASGTWQVIPKKQDQSAEAQQLSLFNQQYESYARDALYGTDLVSLLNKAIDNNERYDVTSGERMYINVQFSLLSNVEGEKNTYKKYIETGEVVKDQSKPTVTTKKLYGDEDYTKKYSLKNPTTKKDIDEFLEKFYGTIISETQRNGRDEVGRYIQYTEEISAGSEFKTRIFKCIEYGYDSEGRINYLAFEEQPQDEEETT